MKKYFELEMNIILCSSKDVITMSQTNNPSLNDNDDTVEDFFD